MLNKYVKKKQTHFLLMKNSIKLQQKMSAQFLEWCYDLGLYDPLSKMGKKISTA